MQENYFVSEIISLHPIIGVYLKSLCQGQLLSMIRKTDDKESSRSTGI